MREKLKGKVKVVEGLKNDLLKDLNQLTPNQLNFKPSSNSWSMAQVVEHLTLAETASLNYVNKKILDPKALLSPSTASKLRSWLLKLFFSLPVKIKRRPAPVTPSNLPDYKNVLLRWNIARNALHKLIEEQSDEILEKLIYKHPFAGRLNANQMLLFFEYHIKHHNKQIKRIKNHKNYPTL